MDSVTSRPRPRDLGKRVSAEQLFQLQNEPVQWLVAGLLSRGITVFSAQPKDGKSVLALQIAAAVALGKDFLGRRVRQGRVLYLSLDEASQDVVRRQAFPFLHEAESEQRQNLDFQFAMRGGPDALVALLKQRHYDLVVIDTLQKFAREAIGGYGTDALKVMEPLSNALTDSKVSVLAIHHATKTGREWTKAGYGSNGIAGGATNIWHLGKSPSAPEEGPYLFNAKGRTIRHESMWLLRKLHLFPELSDPNNPDEGSHAFEWIRDERQPPKEPDPVTRTAQTVLSVLEDADGDGWMAQAELLRQLTRRGIHHARQVIVRQVDRLVAEGMVMRKGSLRRSSYLHRDRVPKPVIRPKLTKKPARPRLTKR